MRPSIPALLVFVFVLTTGAFQPALAGLALKVDERGEAFGELEQELRQNIETGRLGPLASLDLAIGDDAADSKETDPRRQALLEAAEAFGRIREAVAAPAAEAVEERIRRDCAALVERLNRVRPEEPFLDAAVVTETYLESRRSAQRTGDRARPADPGLQALLRKARGLQNDLKSAGQDPAEKARKLAVLMDGLKAHPDLEGVMGTNEYREVVATIKDGLEAVASHPRTPSAQIRALDAKRDSIDLMLSAIMQRKLSVPAPGGETAAPKGGVGDAVAISFHAALRKMFPRTAERIWDRFRDSTTSPAGKGVADQAKVERYRQAIEQAAPKFQAHFSKTPNRKFAFAGGFYDGTYHSRIGEDKADQEDDERMVSWGAGTPRRLAQQAQKYAGFGFLPQYVSDSTERLTLAVLRTMGMLKEAKPGQVIVPKHFPGGPPDLELTENRTVIIRGGFRELSPYLAPFLAILEQKPRAVMVNHAFYPDWERDLRAHWSSLPTAGCPSCDYPASLSPAILRGYLRDGLHFKGLIVADWMDMQGVRAALRELRPRLDPAAQKLPEPALLVVLGTYAGLNWMTGLHPSKSDAAAIQGYANAVPAFMPLLDELAAETSRLRGSAAPAGGWAKAPLHEKVKFLTPMDQAEWSDVWSRGGIMTMSFRVSMVNALNGTNFPNLQDHKKGAARNGFKAEDKWVQDLQADEEFQRLYRAIDWDGPEMREAFYNHFKSLAPAPGKPSV